MRAVRSRTPCDPAPLSCTCPTLSLSLSLCALYLSDAHFACAQSLSALPETRLSATLCHTAPRVASLALKGTGGVPCQATNLSPLTC
eukprot:6173764-Pleurochrysis_carterae.AAC.3